VAAAVSGQRDPPRMVAALHRRSPRACTAVTAGSDGCFFTAGPGHDRVLHVPAIRVKVVNTTGCGDVFHGAYAAALARGEPVERCIRTATAAAAVYASRPGGWQYLATAADVAALPGAG
jgi:sugar/nucleoside kinase (ribokinase family)